MEARNEVKAKTPGRVREAAQQGFREASKVGAAAKPSTRASFSRGESQGWFGSTPTARLSTIRAPEELHINFCKGTL